MNGRQDRFRPLLRLLRRRAWIRNLLVALGVGLFVAGVLRAVQPEAVLAGSVAAALILLVVTRLAGSAWRVGVPDLAAHLDRRFPELEESTALLLADPTELPLLQRLQRARIEPRWPVVSAEPARWLPRLSWRTPLLFAALGLLLLVAVPALGPLLERGARAVTTPATATPGAAAPALVDITVVPPAYTGLDPYTTSEFDVELPESAELTWRFGVQDEAAGTLRLVIGDGGEADRRLPLEPAEDGTLTASTTVRRTGLYRLERVTPSGPEPIPGIHTLTVVPDRPPRLRVVDPAQTRLEISRDGVTTIAYTVRVTDDHGIDAVDIRASVAKGSGEGVKFRDERFAFEHETREDDAVLYERRWRLPDLGMEPGDEVYFFTVARDNRPEAPNEARSDTVVVRWLDEDVVVEWGDGLAVNVMPEYFKSQRQIIIETEQLIADREQLSPDVFEATSRELGQAQSELKERYGQYLGDEFDEGGSPFAAGERGDDDAHDDHDHAPEAQEGEAHADDGHDHDVPTGPDTSGSAAELVARFAHDHGTADIGPITRRNPVGLMKRSIANMWEAELHLRLADPASALPFEIEALKYLDLARQADRIYTRRLGFEPPPVSEERRLSGELDDIPNRRWRREATPDPAPEALLRDLYRLLTGAGPGEVLEEDERELLRRAARLFTERSQERPALIRQAATLERLRVAGRLELPDCDDCLSALGAATWSLLPRAEPAPGPGHRAPADAQAADYLQRLDALRQATPAVEPAAGAGSSPP